MSDHFPGSETPSPESISPAEPAAEPGRADTAPADTVEGAGLIGPAHEAPQAPGRVEPGYPTALPPYPATEAAGPAGRPAGRPSFWRYAAVGLAAGVAGAALTAGAFLLWFDQDEPTAAVEQVQTQVVSPSGGESRAAAVARAVLPSIVTVEVRASTVGDFVAEASGSGVVLRADGLLVTNEHVVDAAGQVRVIFADGRTYPAEVVGQDATTDLAVLRIAAAGLTPIALGSSEDLEIGDTAIAVGSPLGLEGGPSVTAGVVSAFDRQLGTGEGRLFGMIQTDAPITRGSSGGALVDAEGHLIGITTAIGVSDVGAEGLGFAIPVELVAVVTDQLAEAGVASHPFIGIKGTTFFREQADGATVPAGVEVAEVIEGTAAELAGIREGDILLSVAGERLTTMEQLVVMVRYYRVGEQIAVDLERGGEQLTIMVTLLERPEGV